MRRYIYVFDVSYGVRETSSGSADIELDETEVDKMTVNKAANFTCDDVL